MLKHQTQERSNIEDSLIAWGLFSWKNKKEVLSSFFHLYDATILASFYMLEKMFNCEKNSIAKFQEKCFEFRHKNWSTAQIM